MGNEMPFMELTASRTPDLAQVTPVFKSPSRGFSSGMPATVYVLILFMVVAAFGAVTYFRNNDRAVSSPLSAAMVRPSQEMLDTTPSLRDAVRSVPQPAQESELVPKRHEVFVNGTRGYYDARGNFFPIIRDEDR